MKATSTVLLAALLCTSAAAANNPYRLEFYTDQALTNCAVTSFPPGLLYIHVVVKGSAGYTGAVSFKAVRPACMTNAVWIADAWNTQTWTVLASYGNTQGTVGEGVSVFLECLPFPQYLGFILFNVTGPPETCCLYGPSAGGGVENPGYMEIIVWPRCPVEIQDPVLYGGPMGGRNVVLNPNDGCTWCDNPSPVRSSTWGAIKSLYR